jgi:hypothetical protein
VVAVTRHQVGGCRQYLFLSPPGDHRRTRCLSHDLASSKETRPFDNFPAAYPTGGDWDDERRQMI